MFFREDHTYAQLLEKSALSWLEEMSDHEDLAVRGGVKAMGEYIEHLKKEISVLEEKQQLKDQYLKKMKEKMKG